MQLFVSTHNYEFFNLLKDWVTYEHKKVPSSIYLMERCKQSDHYVSCLSKIPKELKDYQSEHVYLFHILHQFSTNPAQDFQRLYMLPNLARRFVESYLAFKIPIKKSLYKKFEIFIDDPIKRGIVYKFVNKYSHSDSISKALSLPDFGECKECIKLLIEQVEAHDKDHYHYLLEGLGYEQE